jgi:ligand-binding SRPBCC domain-containing protein
MHLYTVRTGWEGERLAHYLLSRFSFVAQPTTIADDVGSDFYCTIFDILDSKPPMVEPRTSFAIQVKSNADKIEFHNKVQYLHHLEIPFFLGVVDQTAAELKIYSAECFPMMTAVYGLPKKLWLRPVEECNPIRPYEGLSAQAGITLNCYHVCTFTASEGRDELRPKVAQLLKLCRRTLANIGTRRAEEHIYQLDDDAKRFSIVAGCGSVNYFRDNIYKRLAEAFYNFEYMLNRDPVLFDLAEFRIYEAFHLALVATRPENRFSSHTRGISKLRPWWKAAIRRPAVESNRYSDRLDRNPPAI